MRLLIQRVAEASVTVGGDVVSRIGCGLLVFAGVEDADTQYDVELLARKLCNLRIFGDGDGVMNLDVRDVGGDVLVVSQFTLHAMVRRGNRPSYIKAARQEVAEPLYEAFVKSVGAQLHKKVYTGVFGADMKVALLNDGPVTIWMDSKNLE